MPTSDYVAIRVSGQYTSADTSNPVNFSPADYNFSLTSPGQYTTSQFLVSESNSTTVTLDAETSVSVVMAKNLDTVNSVEVSFVYTDAALVDHANVMGLPAGGVMVLSGPFKMDAGITFTPHTASVAINLCIIGQ